MSIKLPQVQYDLVKLEGGYDLLTPTLSLPSGVAREALNFEVSVNGGYTRIPGYERFDGRPSPNAASFGVLLMDAIANVAVGDTITGAAGSGVVAAIDGLNIVYTKQVGVFSVGESISNGINVVGNVVANVLDVLPKKASEYFVSASNIYRNDIQEVPGSGPIRGLVDFQGTVYAWRNNLAGTEMVIHRSTTSGWQAISLNSELKFKAGQSLAGIKEGDTINGQNSGATALVLRVLVQTGSFSASNATGSLIVSNVTGTFQVNENIRDGGTKVGEVAALIAPITLQPNGRVQNVIASFGSIYQTRVYGCDGVNRGFEFDGTIYAPISTGMSNDTPDNVAVHANHLFFSFDASLQFSGINEPYRWSPIFGAGEIAMRDIISALLPMQGSEATPALVVYSEKETNILYGTSSQTFSLVPYSPSVGASKFTAQRLDTGYALDDRGVVSLATSDRFGNFDSATLTYNIRPAVQSRRTLATASGLNREKSQYRVFLSDGYALYMTVVNGQYMGVMPVQFPNPVLVWSEGDRLDTAERAFFGSSNGFVYRMDVGPSFDGNPIEYSIFLNYNAVKSPRIKKRYRKASIEITGTSYAEFFFGYDLGYGTTEIEQPTNAVYSSNFSTAFWDSFTWDAFTWDGRTLSPTEVEMTGTAENIGLRFFGNANYVSEFTLNSVIMHYTFRRGLR